MGLYNIAEYVNKKVYSKFYDEDVIPGQGGDTESVCAKCKLCITAPEMCDSCANESMYAGNGISFIPMDKEAKKWFRTVGYKKCWGWKPKYWYWKFR